VGEQFGREAVGFLAGRMTSLGKGCGGRVQITVDAFLPIKCEWMNGRFFDYNLQARIRIDEQFRAVAAERVLVGFVRGNLRAGGITAGDKALMGANFGTAGIFLLVENPGNLCGTFYTPGAEGFASARPSYTFLFDSLRDGSEIRMISGPGQLEGRTRSAAGGLWKFAAVVASTLLVLAIACLAYQFRSIDLSSVRTRYRDDASQLPVELNAERTAGGNQWRLSWNRTSPAIRSADKARLIIQDGPLSKEVQLSDAELRIGSIIFSPLTDDVSLSLELFDTARGRDISERIRVLGAPYVPTSGVLGPTSVGPLGGLPVGLSSGLSAVRQSRDSAPPESTPQPSAQRPLATRRAFTPSDAGLITVSRPVSNLLEPPDIQTSGVSLASLASLGSFKPHQLVPPGPIAGSSFAVLGLELNRQADKAAAEPTPASSNVAPRFSGLEPAKLLSRVEPVYPQMPFPRGVPVTVHIEATIGEDGRLHDAKALSGPALFRQSALNAVSRWLYRPAKLSDRNIATPTRIDVNFH
jgi:outer membrane biosynthesis protein TonB